MKSFVAVLFAVIVAINGAAIDDEGVAIAPFIVAPEGLFENAWKHQEDLKELQQDINDRLTAVRTAVSTVLRSSTAETLTQIEANANDILAVEKPVRDEIFAMALRATPCVVNLRVLLNGATEFTGFESSNCVTSYDKSVQGALNTAYALLQKYEGTFGDVQQIVVRSFVGRNIFTQPDDIVARFEEEFRARKADWEAIRPDIESFVANLSGNIAVFNTVLGSCFGRIQSEVAPGYQIIREKLAVCEAYDNTADPFAMFR